MREGSFRIGTLTIDLRSAAEVSAVQLNAWEWTVDDAIYDVGTGIKKAGLEVQKAAR